MMMSELPEDLLEEIFFRVPATSVIRLRSTCKRWNRLLKDMRFTTKHFDEAPKQFQSLMLKESRVCLMGINIRRFSPVKIKREASLSDPYSRVDQIKIWKVSHCDGLLLCYTNTKALVVWNPCTGQTKWIRPRNAYEIGCSYALGSYQDKRSNGNSYKILRHRRHYDSDPWNYASKQEFEIKEINSNSWRILEVTIDFELESRSWGFELESLIWGVSLKGKTFWIGNGLKTDQSGTFKCIISFDYTTERFERLPLLPYQYDYYETLSLSVVREEKLALLLQLDFDEKTEIWVTNKIRETKEVSWTKVLAFDFHPGWVSRSFVYDEEKKVLVFCENRVHETKVYIVGEDIRVRQVELKDLPPRSSLFNYVPSLIPLQHDI